MSSVAFHNEFRILFNLYLLLYRGSSYFTKYIVLWVTLSPQTLAQTFVFTLITVPTTCRLPLLFVFISFFPRFSLRYTAIYMALYCIFCRIICIIVNKVTLILTSWWNDAGKTKSIEVKIITFWPPIVINFLLFRSAFYVDVHI